MAAAYNTVAAIALQGIRQADVRLGESCAVIGLGLIGQLSCLMLRASGINVVGIDINSYAVDMAQKQRSAERLSRYWSPCVAGKLWWCKWIMWKISLTIVLIMIL